jgi:glycosyltransferase involved in cell wall biosynthesis
MRVLHVVKTADGADWAAAQARELVRLGVEVHVALPQAIGRTVQKWAAAGAIIHVAPTDLPIRSPWLLPSVTRRLRALVSMVGPNLIHSHFFGSTVLLRLALGTKHTVPRIFQVPGPLHLEHRFWRMLELSTAGPNDSWIASSRSILAHYLSAGVSKERLYLSYYGIPAGACSTERTGLLRKRYGIADHMKIVGNANFIYPPKWYLAQRIGLKAHEDVIDALGLVIQQRSDVIGVLIGGSPPGSAWYERSLQERARAAGGGRILMTGYLPVEEIRQMWPDFDVAVHVPISENCGGVGEPMLAGVPTIAGRVGGLPEIVIEGRTGTLVRIRHPEELAGAVLRVLGSPEHYLELANHGRALLQRLLSTERIAKEVFEIYGYILGLREYPPSQFDTSTFFSSPVGANEHSASSASVFT